MKQKHKEEVGERIRKVRTSLGLTMEQFGKKFNPEASDSIVSRWESGKSLPNNERLKQITEFGNVTMAYLLEGKYMVRDIHMMPEEEQNKIRTDMVNHSKNLKKSLAYSINQSLDSLDFDKLPVNQLLVINNFFKMIYNYENFDDGHVINSFSALFSQMNYAYKIYSDDTLPNDEKLEDLKLYEDDLVENAPLVYEEIFKNMKSNIQ